MQLKQEKVTLLNQYKVLRNKVTSQLRKENVDYNNNRIEEANNERELWKIANEVLQPKKETEWSIIKEDGSTASGEEEVAELFNQICNMHIILTCT